MTLEQLAKIRARRLKPKDPIHITDDFEVFKVLEHLDVPVICLNLADRNDYRALRGLDVIVVSNKPLNACSELREAFPAFLLGMTIYGFIANLHGVKAWN